MASVGNIALIFAILTALYAILVGFLAVRQDSWNLRLSAFGATVASFLFTGVASVILWHALLSGDFSLAYVASYTKGELPWYYKFAAFWAGQAGSLLLWVLLLSLLAVVVSWCRYPAHVKLGINHVVHAVRLGLLLILMTTTPPFRVLRNPPLDGSGLNPMLQSFGMIIHPPLTFLGFALLTIPFAIVLYAVYSRSSERWGTLVRPWLLWGWVMLTAGIITGGQWAYTELGWGGYWAWDPVENASLLPWLTGTALLHTLALQRRKRGYEHWNYWMVAITFLLCIFATFITRSGIIDSVHAFSDTQVGTLFLLFMVVFLVVTACVYGVRRNDLAQAVGAPLTSLDGMFRLTSVLLLLITVGVGLGTMLPVFTEVLVGRPMVVEESFYNQITIPLWFSLLVLLGVGVSARWFQPLSDARFLAGPVVGGLVMAGVLVLLGMRQPLAIMSIGLCTLALIGLARDVVRARKRIAPHLIHLGVVLIAFGITGSMFNQETVATVDPGERVEIGSYQLKYSGISPTTSGRYTRVATTLQVSRDGRALGEVTSDKVFHPAYPNPASNIGVLGSWREDVYLNLSGWDHDTAILHVSIKPLVAWIWLGSYLMYVGALVLLVPLRRC